MTVEPAGFLGDVKHGGLGAERRLQTPPHVVQILASSLTGGRGGSVDVIYPLGLSFLICEIGSWEDDRG